MCFPHNVMTCIKWDELYGQIVTIVLWWRLWCDNLTIELIPSYTRQFRLYIRYLFIFLDYMYWVTVKSVNCKLLNDNFTMIEIHVDRNGCVKPLKFIFLISIYFDRLDFVFTLKMYFFEYKHLAKHLADRIGCINS